MAMNKQKGNMYGFVTHTWNPIRGKCPHDCSYCYMKVFPQGELRLDEKTLKDDLGEGNYIFVGSSTDMWAGEVPKGWILKVLSICNKYPKNKYLFQSKNPIRFFDFFKEKSYNRFPPDTILCTTIESNRDYTNLKAQSIKDRIQALKDLDGWGMERMITIEPIMDFDLEEFLEMISYSHAMKINIGADSKGHNLPEPSWDKVQKLIKELKKFKEVKVKDNLKRLKVT